MAKLDDEYTPYKKWSRNDYRLAYEEADQLYKAQFQELKVAREQLKELEAFKRANVAWMQHALALGRALDHILQLKTA